MAKVSKYASEYRRVRKNYLQYIRRHEITDYTPLPVSASKGKRDLTKLTREYEKLKAEPREAPTSIRAEYDRTRRQYLKFFKAHPELDYKPIPAAREKTEESLDWLKQSFESAKTIVRLDKEIQQYDVSDEHRYYGDERDITDYDELESLDDLDEREGGHGYWEDITPTIPEGDRNEPEIKEERDGYQGFPLQGEVILENARNDIEDWEPDTEWSEFYQGEKLRDVRLAKNVFEGAIAALGEEQVALNIEAHAVELHALLDRILYGSDGRSGVTIEQAEAEFRHILWGRIPTVEESAKFSDWEMEEEI